MATFIKRVPNDIHHCDSLTNWTAVGVSLAVDSNIYYESGSSIRIAGMTIGDSMYYTFSTSRDFSTCSSSFLYWKQSVNGDHGIRFKLCTDASNYIYWDITPALSSWVKCEFDLSNPTGEVGTFVSSNVNRLEWYFLVGGPFEAWLDFIYIHHSDTDITSDVLAESYIKHEKRDHPKAMIIAKGTWIPTKTDMIIVKDYHTSAGSTTASQIIFEGIVDDYEQTWIRKIPCFSRAKRDLDEYRPKESLSADVDSEHLKTLIGKCAYITEGTIDATTPNTSYELKGDKTFRTILNDWADKHKKMWSLTPTGALNFEDADVDSGEDYDQADKIWAVKPTKQVEKINLVLVYAALVNNVQLSASERNTTSIEQIGEILYKDTYAMITNQTELNTMATNLLAREAPTTLILSINFWNRHINKGLLQVGETITFADSRMNPAITSRQVILRKIKYFPKSQISYFETDDGLVFKKNKDKTLPQENSLLIQQNAESIGDLVVNTHSTSFQFTGNGVQGRSWDLGYNIKWVAIIRADSLLGYTTDDLSGGAYNNVYRSQAVQALRADIKISGTTLYVSSASYVNGNGTTYNCFAVMA